MQTENPGARWAATAKPNTQINRPTCSTGAKMIASAATSAMKVMGPLLRISTESQSVAELLSPCRLMLMTG
ncbi:hypothetical protein D3C85_1911190 [compost metagenome]